MKSVKIPESVLIVMNKIKEAGFESYLVGGCVRDLLMNREPKDWDITTNAKPKEVLKVFPKGKYENEFGTVLLPGKYLLNLKFLSKEVSVSIEKVNKLKIIAQGYIEKFEKGCHDTGHSERVMKNSLKISKNYSEVKKEIIELISLFHDVGKSVGNLEKHIENSQKIFQEETQNILNEEEIEILKEAINHKSNKKVKYIEEQVLIEADLLDAISLERCKNAQKYKPNHFEWIKEVFNNEEIYRFFKTPKGIELLKKTINEFNEASFGLKIPKYNIENNIEITTYRIESKYTDKRHPDEIKFAKTLREDLSRRDFCINAIALKIPNNKSQITNKFQNSSFKIEIKDENLVDPFDGKRDLENKIIRAVGVADERFSEDALRMMRAIRFACTQNGISNAPALSVGRQFPISNKISESNLKTKNRGIDSGSWAGMKNRGWQIEEKTLRAIEKMQKI